MTTSGGGSQGEDVSLNRSHCADFLALETQEEAPLSSNHQLQHWPLEMRINYAHQRKPTLDWRPMSCGWSVDDDRVGHSLISIRRIGRGRFIGVIDSNAIMRSLEVSTPDGTLHSPSGGSPPPHPPTRRPEGTPHKTSLDHFPPFGAPLTGETL